MPTKEEDYKGKIKDLLKKIKKIISSDLEEVKKWNEIKNKDLTNKDLNGVKSDEIMKYLREQCLFLHEVYLDDYANSSDHATLDFHNAYLKFDISNVEDLPTKFYPLFGNSFGPFNSKAYFESKIKILWLLKESYINKESWIQGDRGGHIQAQEYNKWENIKGTNDTKERVVKITKKILSVIDKYGGWDNDSDETNQKVMDHICIVEVQHFPGLNFTDVETDDGNKHGKFRDWARLNKPLYETLIKFYLSDINSLNIIIGGKTLQYLFPYEDENNNLWMDCGYKNGKSRLVQIEELVEQPEPGLKLLDNKIIAFIHDEKHYPNEILIDKEKNSHQAYLDDKGIIYIDAYHLSHGQYSEKDSIIDAKRINILKGIKEKK